MGVAVKNPSEETGVVSVHTVERRMLLTTSQHMLIQGRCEKEVVKVVMHIEVVPPSDEIMILSKCRIVPKDKPKQCLAYD